MIKHVSLPLISGSIAFAMVVSAQAGALAAAIRDRATPTARLRRSVVRHHITRLPRSLLRYLP